MDGTYLALELTQPASVEAVSANQTDFSPPTGSMVTYQFPARGALPPVKWNWYDGGMMPPLPPGLILDEPLPVNGTLLVGSKAVVLADTYYETVKILPKARMSELASSLPPATLPRVEGGHFAEWVRACKGGPAAGSNFEYSSRLTETVLLSNVAVRARRRIEWDAAAMQVTNFAEANRYVTKTYRPGFGV